MVKCRGRPRAAWCALRKRAPKAWKVYTQTSAPCPGASSSMRLRISAAALFVKVTARILPGGTPVSSRRAAREVMTRVLPVPAPASTSRGPLRWVAPAFCSGLSLSRSTGIGGVSPTERRCHNSTKMRELSPLNRRLFRGLLGREAVDPRLDRRDVGVLEGDPLLALLDLGHGRDVLVHGAVVLGHGDGAGEELEAQAVLGVAGDLRRAGLAALEGAGLV